MDMTIEKAKQDLQSRLRFGDDRQIRANRFLVAALEGVDLIREGRGDRLEDDFSMSDEEIVAARQVNNLQERGENPMRGLPGVA